MPYKVIFTPEAEDQLATIYRYIAAAASLSLASTSTMLSLSLRNSLSL